MPRPKKPGIFQRRVLLNLTEGPATVRDLMSDLELTTARKDQLERALNSLYVAGYVEEDYDTGPARYTLLKKGRSAVEEVRHG